MEQKNDKTSRKFIKTVIILLVTLVCAMITTVIVGSFLITDKPQENLYVSEFSTASTITPKTFESEYLANIPQGIWLTGDETDSLKVKSTINDAKRLNNLYGINSDEKKLTPIFVLYNLPSRDSTGGHSSGGAKDSETYKTFIKSFSNTVSNYPSIIVLEPDGLADLDSLKDENSKIERISLLQYAVDKISKNNPNSKLYVDLGNNGWNNSSEAASLFKLLKTSSKIGFSLNVSNYYATKSVEKYGNEISKLLPGNNHYIVDTSRNGGEVNDGWCNPDGAKTGELPTYKTTDKLVDYYLWIKNPGESDGVCGLSKEGAGEWDQNLAKILLGLK